VVVADDGLIAVPAAGVLAGVDEHSVLLIYSSEDADTWRERLNTAARLLVSPLDGESSDAAGREAIDVACAAAPPRRRACSAWSRGMLWSRRCRPSWDISAGRRWR
jgi:hypothetical protein